MESRLRNLALAALSFLVFLFVWSGATYGGFIQSFFLPTPVEVIRATFHLFAEQSFMRDIGISAARIFVGFIAAALLAVPLGILVGLQKKAEVLIEPVVGFIRYTPIPAFIPLFILWFGIGETEKIIVIANSVFFQLVLLVANSASSTPREFVESARTLGATKWQIVRRIIFPFSQPRILDDLRISMGWAWSALMMAEIVGSSTGIGSVIIQSQRLLQTSNVIAAIIIVGLLGVFTDVLFKKVHKIYFPWSPRISHYA